MSDLGRVMIDSFFPFAETTGPVTVRVAPQSAVRVGSSVGLSASAAHANWFDVASGLRLG